MSTFKLNFKRILIRLLISFSIILCIVTAILIYKEYQERELAQSWVRHTNKVIQNAQNVQIFFRQSETNQRGYLLTGDSTFLEQYRSSIIELEYSLKTVRNVVSDNIPQTNLLNLSLVPSLELRLQQMRKTIELFELGKNNSVEYFERLKQGQAQDNLVQKDITLLIQNEYDLLKKRTDELYQITGLIKSIMLFALTSIGVISVMAYLVIRRTQGENIVLINSLSTLNMDLENRVSEQTKFLSESNTELQIKNDDLITLNEELRSSEEEVRANLDYITSLKSSLEKSEALHRMLSENSLDIIAVFSIDNTFEYLSPSVKKVLGYEPEELIGRKGIELVHPDDLENLTSPSQMSQSEKEILIPHFRLKKKDGSYVWIEAYSKPIVNFHGETMKIQSLNRDISERKLYETQLKIAKDKAEDATKAKSQFLSTMSHEIRTPMNAVIGLTNILLDSSPKPDQIHNLKLLKFSGENLLTIINDILDFSKIEAGKMTIEAIPFSLFDLINNVKGLNQARADDKGIALTLNFTSDVNQHFIGDPVRLNQILTNLISNAIKFTEKGYVEIDIKAHKTSQNGNEIVISIKDTGVGIEPHKLDLIFESFSQANSDTTRKFGGTGLGLTITKSLVLLMGGEISIESKVGYGSTFKVSLPLEGSAQMKNTDVSLSEINNDDFVDGKLLLVEDNDTNQYIAKNFLEKWGMTVVVANNGDEAIQLVKSKSFDLILMDLQMPVMDGYAATAAIRNFQDKYFKSVPIIALTADAMTETKKLVQNSLMNDYVSKPFNPAELKAKILKHLGRGNRSYSQQQNWIASFEDFTKGDLEYKKDLSKLIIGNLNEFQKIVSILKPADDANIFSLAVHRIKTSLKILSDTRLEKVINSIKSSLADDDEKNLSKSLEQFNLIISGIKEGLTKYN